MRFILAALLVAAPVAAFSSLPVDESSHDEITKQAARAVDYPEDGIAALREAVRAPDVEEFKPEPDIEDGHHIDATEAFRAEHHCDRVPPEDNQTAFEDTTAYVQEQRQEARAFHSAEEAVEALGRALHAAQDCFAHSNYVDLDASAQEAFVRAVLHGGEAPEGTILTAFRPGTDETTDPDDPYPHDRYAKDAPDKNDESRMEIAGRTKYEIAHEAAVQVSAAIIADFFGPLDAAQREELAELRASDTAGKPGPGPLLLLPLLAAAALRRR